ncbi:MAG: beta-N-acetylhexosaminidase [Candidatus Accumulibacter sp.]|jgi:beta-N-acetylhexosaminidase|nr:beta-N-acetylhexosaminidase [Accumulibacter sp.]
MSLNLPHGPLMIDLAGPELTDAERRRLSHPSVGGLILFARNYASPEQLSRLTAEVHALRSPPLLIAIDHEGGRVQRCREGFTRLPAMRRLGGLWERDPQRAPAAAREIGYVLAAELRRRGVDLSFTPVLDLDHGRSGVIGDRSFHRHPHAVVLLAGRLIEGLRAAGMKACGKHFPGHGWTEADSHVAVPVDERPLDEIEQDLRPFRELPLDAVMPAHVIYPRVDSRPAGFSPVWLAKLREELRFDGAIFSDDLSMQGASVAGDILDRAAAAWRAGCDMLLVCNSPEKADEVLENWRFDFDARRSARVAKLLPAPGTPCGTRGLENDPRYLAAIETAAELARQTEEEPESTLSS